MSRLLTPAALLLLLASPAEAQWRVEAQAGQLRPVPGGVTSSNAVLGVGVQYAHPSAGFRMAAGVPTRADQPHWGTVGGWARLVQGHRGFSAGVDLSGQGTGLRDREGGLREVPGLLGSRFEPVPVATAYTIGAQGMPLVAYESGVVRVQARAGAAHLWVQRGEATGTRTVPLADLQLTLLLSDAVAIAPVVRRFHEPGDQVSDYLGMSAVMARGPVTLNASVGSWSGVTDAATPWAAGATLRPAGRFLLTAGARHDGYDPITRQPAQTSFSVSVGIRLGRDRGAVAVAPVAAIGRDGRTVLRLPVAVSPVAPRIAGDFTDWKPRAMDRVGEFWSIALPLAAGVYHYAFVAADGTWFVPESTPGRRSDGMGGYVAVVVVR